MAITAVPVRDMTVPFVSKADAPKITLVTSFIGYATAFDKIYVQRTPAATSRFNVSLPSNLGRESTTMTRN